MGLIDFIFPKKCLECKAEGRYICEFCIGKVPVGGWINLGETKVYSVWRYKGVVRKAIIALKYKFATEIADELIDHIKFLPSSQNLVPIPSHWRRQNTRGFNQSALLGEKLASKMNWKYIPNLLIKSRSTPPQVGLKRDARQINLKGVFVLNPKLKIPRSVLIFDDVYTTGSTLKEVVKTLRRSGVKRIWCLTVAR
jgi:ComF family protein